MMKKIALCSACSVVALSMSLLTNYAQAGVIISDTFTRTGSLNGSTPDINPGTSWNVPNDSSANHTTDGSVLNMVAEPWGVSGANIGFTLDPGLIYTLSVDVNVGDTGEYNWLNVGFTTDLTNGGTYYGGLSAWMLLRSQEVSTSDDIQTFTANNTGVVDYELASFTNTGTMKIELDTTNLTNYSAKWFFNGNLLGTGTIGAPAITGVFLGNYDQTGTFDNFLLTDNAVPEPASIAMWGIGAVGLMFARRKRQQKKLPA
jgi:PEP-CTERM motif